MKAIRWLLKLVLAMITLPLILAVWLIKWFVVFLHHCSACRAAAAGAVLKPQGGNFAVLPILSQVAGHLLLLKSSNYSRLVSKEILCTEIQIVLFNKLNTKTALYSRHFTSRFHVFVYQAACQPLPSLSPYQLSPFSLSRQIPSFGRLF